MYIYVYYIYMIIYIYIQILFFSGWTSVTQSYLGLRSAGHSGFDPFPPLGHTRIGNFLEETKVYSGIRWTSCAQ